LTKSKSRSEAYQQAGNHPVAWWRVGENLLLSGQLLRNAGVVSMPLNSDVPDDTALRDIRRAEAVLGPSLMLRAFGVEALFKALFLDRGGVLADGGRFRSPTRRPHDLCGLAKQAGCGLSAEETSLLGVLEYWIEEGRYPIQANVSKYDRAGSKAMPLSHQWHEEDEELFRRFVARVLQEGKAREVKWTNWKKWGRRRTTG